MEQTYIKFINWFNGKDGKIVKYGVASSILIFSYFLYFAVIAALFSIIGLYNNKRGFWIIEKAESISSQMLSDIYMIAPYLMIIFLFIILILYRNIFLKIAMILISLIGLVFQFGALMGFRTYWDFLYFMPQVILFIMGFWTLYRIHKWRS